MTSESPLTAEEHRALALSGQLAGAIRAVIGEGPQAPNDWREAAFHIHGLQRMILANAGARAYPELYRLLGGNPFHHNHPLLPGPEA